MAIEAYNKQLLFHVLVAIKTFSIIETNWMFNNYYKLASLIIVTNIKDHSFVRICHCLATNHNEILSILDMYNNNY